MAPSRHGLEATLEETGDPAVVLLEIGAEQAVSLGRAQDFQIGIDVGLVRHGLDHGHHLRGQLWIPLGRQQQKVAPEQHSQRIGRPIAGNTRLHPQGKHRPGEKRQVLHPELPGIISFSGDREADVCASRADTDGG